MVFMLSVLMSMMLFLGVIIYSVDKEPDEDLGLYS